MNKQTQVLIGSIDDQVNIPENININSDPVLNVENVRKKRKTMTFVDKLLILENWKRGVRRLQIADDLNFDKSTVYKVIKDADTICKNIKASKFQEEVEEFKNLYPVSMLMAELEELEMNAQVDLEVGEGGEVETTAAAETPHRRRKKRTQLTIADKLNIIRLSRCGVPHYRIVEKYGTAESTIGKIIRSQTDIISSCETARMGGRGSIETKKHRRNGPYHRVNELVYQWYTQKQASIGPDEVISRRTVKAKAKEIAHGMAETEAAFGKFKGSDGWLDSFYRVYGIRDTSTNTKLGKEAMNISVLEDAKQKLDYVMEIARDAGLLYEERAMTLAQLAADFEELTEKGNQNSDWLEVV